MTLPPVRTLRPRTWVHFALVLLRSGAWLDAQLDALLARRAVITVQEQITSSRIFRHLRRHRVWHASCGEIASYFRTRERTRVAVLSDDRFLLSREEGAERVAPLSLVLNGLRLPETFVLR